MNLKRKYAAKLKVASMLGVLLSGAGVAAAQGHGAGGGHGPMGGGGLGAPSSLAPSRSAAPNTSAPAGNSTARGGQLGPASRWWDDALYAQRIGINSHQQKRMDQVFDSNKPTLLKLYKNLQSEQSQLDKASRAKDPDEAKIFDQISRVSQARSELEKAYAHLQLQLRHEMTPEQAAKLDEHRNL